MKKEDIINLAKECGLLIDSNDRLSTSRETSFHVDSCYFNIERFAALISAAERETCAKLCDNLDDDLPDGLAGWQYGEAIRERGNK